MVQWTLHPLWAQQRAQVTHATHSRKTIDLSRTATLWTVQSEYTSALTISSAVFINPKSFWPAAGYFYEAIELHVPTTGMYTISSSSSLDTQGFLYNHSYDLASPQQNLIAFNDDAGGTSNQFKLAVALQAMARYILLVTTYLECVTGSFTIIGLGPAELNFSARKF